MKKLPYIDEIKKEPIYVAAVVWTCAVCFVPVHHVFGAEGLHVYTTIGIYIPTLLLLLLRINPQMPHIIRTEKFWRSCFAAMLAVALTSVVYAQVTERCLIRESAVLTLGLVVILAALMMKKHAHIGVWQASVLGLLSAAFLASTNEIIYQVCRYFFAHQEWSSLTDVVLVVKRQIILLVPFVIACLMYKLKPTKWTWGCLGVYVTLMLIWIFPCHFWSIQAYVGHTEVLNTPINWPVYQMVKSTKVVFAGIIYSLR